MATAGFGIMRGEKCDFSMKGFWLLQVVINHNIPGLAKNYVHRVGRTARAGRSGLAISLVTQFDIHRVESIEEHISMSMLFTCWCDHGVPLLKETAVFVQTLIYIFKCFISASIFVV